MTMGARLAMVLLAAIAGCAHVDRAQIADSATTAVAITHGFTEANPLFADFSWPWIAATKIAVTQVVKLTPEPICEPGLMALTFAGYNAALWNIGVMAGSGPASIPVMVLVTWFGWDLWWNDAQQVCANPFSAWASK